MPFGMCCGFVLAIPILRCLGMKYLTTQGIYGALLQMRRLRSCNRIYSIRNQGVTK